MLLNHLQQIRLLGSLGIFFEPKLVIVQRNKHFLSFPVVGLFITRSYTDVSLAFEKSYDMLHG